MRHVHDEAVQADRMPHERSGQYKCQANILMVIEPVE